MELEYFTSLERIPHNDITIFMITVLKELPTPLQWQFTIESFREEFSRVKNEHNKFAFIMDVRKIGRISIAQIKEFVNLLESYTFVLQDYLVATSILTTKNSILAILFDIMKTFYKTKKPLLFVYDMKSAYEHIDSFDKNIVRDT
jgi:alpha-N-acetylglucosamine transferase